MSTYGDKTFGKPLLETEEMDYDTSVSSAREKHGFSYTYDDDTGFMLSRSWYKSNYTKCTERFTYDSKGRLTSYKAHDGTTTSYTYEYTGGKVSKKTTTVENDTGTTVVVENYTSETFYAFPSTVIKTVTSNNITNTETISYTYDMLYGVVKTMTDDDGNTTYYEYDDLGRPTRIIYPAYSTYSSYGNKNIRILPVEDIIYQTVSYKYSGVIDSDENLICQRITNDVTYYDVSNVNTGNPAALDLSTLTNTFYARKQNYYLGTGELIRSDVGDIVDGVYTTNTTNYYYSTVINFVKEVDAKGNTTITYYDGAGREVQVTDQFDNDHITEYNISGDGVGFKALSYFVPASDGNVKQNVIEYTYDRLGRTTKEKGYSSYPDTSVEVDYAYDFVGNVIGMRC